MTKMNQSIGICLLVCVTAASCSINGYLACSTDVPTSINIILREQWNARQAKRKTKIPGKTVPFIVVHHSATSSCYDESNCMKSIRAFQNYHMDIKKWDDIAYNFIVGEDGNVYEGRGWGVVGSHASNYNRISMGICVVGTFTDKVPNKKALDALQQLIEYGVETNEINSDYHLIAHRQASATECPGATFYELLKTWDHWTPVSMDPR